MFLSKNLEIKKYFPQEPGWKFYLLIYFETGSQIDQAGFDLWIGLTRAFSFRKSGIRIPARQRPAWARLFSVSRFPCL